MSNNQSEHRPVFEVTAASEERCGVLTGAVSTVLIMEGLKSLHARSEMGLPMPSIEGKPVHNFLNIQLSDPTEMQMLAIVLGRRAGLGAYWVATRSATSAGALGVGDDLFAEAVCNLIDFDGDADHGE